MTNYKKTIYKNYLFISFFFLFLINELLIKAPNAHAAATCGLALGIICNPLVGTVNSVSEAIVVIIQYLFSVIGIISLLFLIIGGVKYVISFGNEEKMTSAKNTFSSAAYGLIIALMAYAILEIIHGIINP